MKKKITIRSFPIAGFGARDLVWTAALTSLAAVAPALLAHTPHNQWITGTIVNALLFVTAWRLGLANSILVAALPSSIALIRGLLPIPLAILAPYIIISNILLVSIFMLLKRNLPVGILVSSLAKFGFLFAVSSYFASKLASPFIIMMQWPQLITALAGGFIAAGAITFLKNPVPEAQEKI